jgi:hypothetical protein
VIRSPEIRAEQVSADGGSRYACAENNRTALCASREQARAGADLAAPVSSEQGRREHEESACEQDAPDE